jgi:enoyl-CoA hydratase/carnithine racemase
MGRFVTLEHFAQAAIITLHSPPANLLTVDSLNELALQFDALRVDADARAVVLTGAGDRYFCGGMALTLLAGGDKGLAARVVDALQAAITAIRAFDGVKVAAVNGYAMGSGLELALACDYIVAERGAVLGLPQTSVGLVPCAGGDRFLADRIGMAWTKRIVLGGERLDADKAFQIGLVEEVVDPGLAKIIAVSMANKVARQGPTAVCAARRLLEASMQRSLEAHLQSARQSFLDLIGTQEHLSGVAAFLGKQEAPWYDDDDDE